MRLRASSTLAATLLYAISVVAMRGISFFMLPFVASHLSTEEFGQVELLCTYAVLASVIFSFGLEHALYRFCGGANNETERQQIAAQIYRLCLGAGALVMLAAIVIGGRQALSHVYSLIGMTIALETLISVPLGWLRMQNRSLAFCATSLLRALCQALLTFVLLSQGGGVVAVFQAGLLAALVAAAVLFSQMPVALNQSAPWSSYHRYLSYGWPLVGSGLLAFALSGVDRWLVAEQTSLDALAYYAIAAKCGLLVTLAIQPYGMWYMPKRFDLLKAANGQALSHRYALLGLQLTLLASLGVGLSAALFIRLFLPESYSAAIVLIPLAVAAAGAKELTEYINIGCLAGQDTKTQLVIQLLASVFGVVAMLGLGSLYGAWGVMAGLALAQVLRLALFYRAAKRHVDLGIPVVKLMLLGALCVLLCFAQNGGLDATPLGAWASVLADDQHPQAERSLLSLLGQAVASLALYGLAVALLFAPYKAWWPKALGLSHLKREC